jgi:DNA-binding response OmpR family regulator
MAVLRHRPETGRCEGGRTDLLLAFVEHPQRVLTRDQLIEYAHGSSYPAFDRSIDIQGRSMAS